jgi:hypothetical protein
LPAGSVPTPSRGSPRRRICRNRGQMLSGAKRSQTNAPGLSVSERRSIG